VLKKADACVFFWLFLWMLWPLVGLYVAAAAVFAARPVAAVDLLW